MDHSRRNPDRADPLRSLRKALARGSLQVLQQHVRGGTQPPHCQDESRARGSRDQDCDPNDLTHRCEQCGEPLPEGSRSSRKFCSWQCRERDRITLERQARAEENAARQCRSCGQPIPPNKRRNAEHCSQRCISADQRRRIMAAAAARDCAQCGATFQPDKPGRKFCCLKCAKNALKRRHDIACAVCSKSFHPKTYTARFCSLNCVAKAGHASGRLHHWHRHLTAKRLDKVFDRMRPRRPYRQHLTPARLDAMLERVSR